MFSIFGGFGQALTLRTTSHHFFPMQTHSGAFYITCCSLYFSYQYAVSVFIPRKLFFSRFPIWVPVYFHMGAFQIINTVS